MWGNNLLGWQGSSGGGGGTISGSIAAPDVAFGTAADTIGGDDTFTFNKESNKEVAANKVKINNVALTGSPVNGYLEYDGSQLYFTTGGTRYKVSLTT